MRQSLLVWTSLIFAVLTGASAMASKQALPLIGVWGGDRLNLELSNAGGSLMLDCTSGDIDGPVRPDANGHFKAKGHWETHSSGPQRADEPAQTSVAIFQGHVAGNTMHLAVTADGALQHFTLVQGKRAKLVRCL